MEFKGVRPWAVLVLLIGFTLLLSSVAAIDSEGGNIASTGVENGVSVGISPPENSALNGEDVVFTVSVTNTDNEGHIFTLESSDVKNWQISLNKDNLLLDPDNSGNVALTVSIPENAHGGMEDNITVTATAENDNTITGENSCTVLLESSIGFDLSITPFTDNGFRGDSLSYTVNVQNTGNVVDSYDLNVIENAGWGDNVNLSGTTITNLSPNEIDNVSLDVTIPDWASFGSHAFMVEAVSENDNTVTDNANCALDVEAPLGVQVFISPSDKSGEPGDDLSYEVLVKNTGDTPDNYDLVISDTQDWSLTLDNTQFENVAPGENRKTTLTASIPADALAFATDNLTGSAISQTDNTISDSGSSEAQVIAVENVDVTISPPEGSALRGDNLNFTIDVRNIGNVSDNYDLLADSEAGWNLSLSKSSFENIGPGTAGRVTLTVTVPENEAGGSNDNITVTATSRRDNTVESSATCTANALTRGIEVSISPSENIGSPGENLGYTVTVTNTGNVELSSLNLGIENIADWGASISPSFPQDLTVDGSYTGRLTVKVPSSAENGDFKNVVVRVEVGDSRSPEYIEESSKCRAVAEVSQGISVNITPSENGALTGESLLFTVNMRNTGERADNYELSVSDSAGWGLELSDNIVDNVSRNENRTVDLTVMIPDAVDSGIEDNITVTVTSQTNESVSENAICIARSLAPARGVEISISPSEREWTVGNSTSYTVTIKNTGDVPDNYILTLSDNANWDTSLSMESVEDVSPGGNKTVSLNVTVPSETSPDTVDNITVTATSQNDPSADDSASCIGKALILKSVKVEVSSSFKSGRPGEEVVFEVIVTNTGQADGNFNLTATATPGWNPSVEPSSLTLSSGQSDNAKLVVEIPSNIGENETGSLEARASLLEDSDITSADTCRVGVSGSPIGGGISLPSLWTIIWIIIIGAIIAGVIIVVRYLFGRRGKERPSRVLSDLGSQKERSRSSVLRDLSE